MGQHVQHRPTGHTPHRMTGSELTMEAIVRDVYGPADVLRLIRIARPRVGADEVLVQVHAAGLDRGAWHLMTGKPHLLRLGFGIRRPRNPMLGREVAGTVVQVGSAVTRFTVGDEVFGIGSGAFAEYAVCPETKLARKPANVTFEHAAAVPVSALTALQALRDSGRVGAGNKVLVTGASGGVGGFAVQLAKAFGAEVTGVCSTTKRGFVQSLGADHVVDYTRSDFADGVHRYDLVLDIAGNPTLTRLRRALTPKGTAVIVGGEEGGSFSGGMNRQLRAAVLSVFVRQRLTMLLCRENSADLDVLAQMLEAGQLRPSVSDTFTLADVPLAMRHLAAGNVSGKVVITCSASTAAA